MNVSCESLSSSSTHMASSSVLMDNKKQRRFDNLDRYRLKILHRIHDALEENEGNAFGDQTFWKLRGLFQHLENIEAAMKAYV